MSGIMELKDKRKIGLDLLKIIAIVMIIMSHSIPRESEVLIDGINPDQATKELDILACIFYQYNANLANLLFVICSAVFLTREETKYNKIRLLSIIRDNWMISVIFLFVAIAVGVECGVGEIIIQFIPTIWGTNWFVTTYVLYYLTVPCINIVIKNMSQRSHLQICIILIFLFCIVQFVLKGKLYYTWWLGFIIIHILVAYKQRYLKPLFSYRFGKAIFTISIVCYIGLVFVTDFIGLNMPIMFNRVQYWNQFLNPFEVIIGIGLVDLFIKIQIDSKRIKQIIVSVSACSLEIYLIHNNYMVKTYWRPQIWEWIYKTFGFEHLNSWVLVVTFTTLIISGLMAYIYHFLLSKGKHTVLKQVVRVFDILTDRIINIK